MASDGEPVQIPATSLVHGSQATTVIIRSVSLPSADQSAGAKADPSGGQSAATLPAGEPAKSTTPAALVTLLNKYLNDSGRPDQFRVDPTSDANIQEVNPATGAVIAEYSASEFPALARSVGLTGGLVDGHA